MMIISKIFIADPAFYKLGVFHATIINSVNNAHPNSSLFYQGLMENVSDALNIVKHVITIKNVLYAAQVIYIKALQMNA